MLYLDYVMHAYLLAFIDFVISIFSTVIRNIENFKTTVLSKELTFLMSLGFTLLQLQGKSYGVEL